MNNKTLKLCNTLFFAAMIIVNALANILPIGGNTTGEVAESYPNLFSPAPVTFFIWGVIYLLLAVFTVYQWVGRCSGKLLTAVGIWFCVSCILNIGWLLLWHGKLLGLSLIVIILLLVSLVIITNRISSLKLQTPLCRFVTSGFYIYFGWLIAAVIANVSVWLTSVGWDGFLLTDVFWCITVLLAGAVIASATVIIGGKRLPSLAVVWAYIGIIIRHVSSVGYSEKYPDVILAAVISIAIILINIIYRTFKISREK